METSFLYGLWLRLFIRYYLYAFQLDIYHIIIVDCAIYNNRI